MEITKFLNSVNEHILNPIIMLLFAIATLVFVYGIFQFINSASADSKRDEGKQKILWGLVGMFIMFGAYGLINVILGTFDIDPPDYLEEKL